MEWAVGRQQTQSPRVSMHVVHDCCRRCVFVDNRQLAIKNPRNIFFLREISTRLVAYHSHPSLASIPPDIVLRTKYEAYYELSGIQSTCIHLSFF